MSDEHEIDPDVRSASTLPSATYTDPGAYRAQLDRVFARSWQLLPVLDGLPEPEHVLPCSLLEGALDEPLVLSCDAAGELHCLSNVCTHRANLVATRAGPARGLRCGYHGRRFGLDGRCLSMPEFEQVRGFPAASDDLPQLPIGRWGDLAFVSLQAAYPFDPWIEPVRARMGFAADGLVFDPGTSRDYTVDAHWALYCDNYLEGFHIPFVHDALADVLDYGAYRTELFPYGTLQIGVAEDREATFELPAGHPDAGERVAAYYFWLFPNTMLNFYPWGLSVNLVVPLGPERTRIRFLSYVRPGAAARSGAGADLHRVELEDEALVEAVQRGVRSRLYDRGRFSASQETGVHHFHRLLAAFLRGETQGIP